MRAASLLPRTAGGPEATLQQLTLDLSMARGVDEVLASVRGRARSLIGADGVTFVLREGRYCHYADEDAISPLWKGQKFPMETCISGWAMMNREPAVIEDIYADDRIPHAAYRPTFVRSLVMMPVRADDPVAAIGAYWARTHRATEAEIDLLRGIANAAAVALTNVSLFRSLVHSKEEAERAKAAIILAMGSLAETRDNDTGNHLRRTQHYLRALAEECLRRGLFPDELDTARIELLYKSAPLHDVGKVGIPDRILLKPGRLDPDEMEIMKTHAELGRAAIAAAERHLGAGTPFFQTAREIAHTHHERWDGGGYPRGLAGNDIPLPGRLMAIADVYDALVSERVYKKAMPHAQAVAVILAERGRQFDPAIVDVFADIAPQFAEIHARFADEA